MTTLTDTNDPDIWAMEFVRLFGLNPNDTRHVSEWFKSAMETAVKLDKMPGMAHTFPVTEAIAAAGAEQMEHLASTLNGQDPDPKVIRWEDPPPEFDDPPEG